MKYVIIDVREAAEFAGGHVADAINIPLGQLVHSSELANISKDAAIIVYCFSGSRSAMAKSLLGQLGYTNVTNGMNQRQTESLLQS